MKTGFRTHLFSGIIVVLVFQIMALFLYPELLSNVYYTISSSVFFILGAVMPDIDSKKSIPHRHFKRIYFVLIFSLCSIFLYFVFSNFGMLSDFYMWIILVFGSLLFSYISVSLSVRKLRHRGFMHSPLMSLIYGTVIFLVFYFLNIGTIISLAIGFFAMAGWYLHRIIDKTGDSLK